MFDLVIVPVTALNLLTVLLIVKRIHNRRSFGAIWVDLANFYHENRCPFRVEGCSGKIEKIIETYDFIGNSVKLDNNFVCDKCSSLFYSVEEVTRSVEMSKKKISDMKLTETELTTWHIKQGHTRKRYLHFWFRWERKK